MRTKQILLFSIILFLLVSAGLAYLARPNLLPLTPSADPEATPTLAVLTPIPENQPQESEEELTPSPASEIRLDSLTPNQVITSPVVISGEAPGTWFFEASLPIRLETSDGRVLAQTAATTSEDWMTTELIPFTATLEFTQPQVSSGFIVIEKSNPSGLPENSAEYRVPVTF